MAATDEDLPPTDAEICQAKVVFERGAAGQLWCSLPPSMCHIVIFLSHSPRSLDASLDIWGKEGKAGLKSKATMLRGDSGLASVSAYARMCAKSVVG